jgi:transcriptional antiterminator Rof (Rho-off)
MGDFDAKYRLQLEAALESGEELRGICAANHRQSAFKGRLVAIGVTDRRLLVLPIDRRGGPADSPQPIVPEQIASAKAGGAGGGWATVEAAIADHSAVKLDLRMKDGEKLKLMMMHGKGVFGGLGGGESQREGIAALAEWFGRLDAR